MSIISVIVPVYNVEQYLRRCIDSILAQTFIDFELILVDDGSQDQSGLICDEYAKMDRRVRVLHTVNGGVSVARNVGLDIICGKYVAFCDSDDYWKRDWLELLYVAMEEKQVDCVSGSHSVVSENGIFQRLVSHRICDYELETKQKKIDYLAKVQLSGVIGWEIWTRLFKSEIIQKQRIRFCEKCDNFAEDLCFVLEYSLYCERVSTIGAEGYCYVQRDTSMMHKSEGSIKLNSMNEVSVQFGKRFFEVFTDKSSKKQFPILHFLIMNNQYTKLISVDKHNLLPKEIKKINNKGWYNKYTFSILIHRENLNEYFGSYNAKRIILLSMLCCHKIWKLFVLQRMIFYRMNKG